ncbi:MAG TPA: glycosyl hydrolase [Prolixibacteraceae bacterium]|nr:glycosyl hydrolase [Prolixibacteraceae bacterium]
MKIIFISLLFTVLIFSCRKAEEKVYMFSFFKDNGQDGLHLTYSRDGYQWEALKDNRSFLTPAVAKDKLMRDPCIIQGTDSKFHMVWTVSWNDRGIGYASSEDLVHWSEQKFIPVMEHESEALNCWAPEIFYDEDQHLYMIYWATTIPGRFPESDRQGDSKYNHRMYYTTTVDFNTFQPAKLLYDGGFNVIDAVIKKIGANYYMFLKDETKDPVKKHIRIAVSDTLTGNYHLISEPITPDWVEVPTVASVDGYWVVYYDEYTRHRMGAVRSKDLKNWEVISDSVSFPDGTRHGTVFQVNECILETLLKE